MDKRLENITRDVKNLRRTKTPDTSRSRLWLEEGIKSEELDSHRALPEIQHGLQATESWYNQRPRRPYEWPISNKEVEDLELLKAKNRESVEKYENPAIFAQEVLEKEIKKSEELQVINTQKLKAAKEIKEEISRKIRDEGLKLGSDEDLKDKLSSEGQAKLKNLDIEIQKKVEKPMVYELRELEEAINQLKTRRRSYGSTEIPESLNDQFREALSLKLVFRLVRERELNGQQQEALQDCLDHLTKLQRRIPKGNDAVNPGQIKSMLGMFGQGVTSSKLEKQAQELAEKLRASINNRAGRIAEIGALLSLPPKPEQTRIVNNSKLIGTNEVEEVYHDMGNEDFIIEKFGGPPSKINTSIKNEFHQWGEKRKSLDSLKTGFGSRLNEERDQIQHTEVKISKPAQMRDTAKKVVGFKASKRTPERVNEQVDQCKAALEKVGKKIDSLDSLPNEQGSLFVAVARSLLVQFQSARKDAIDSYDSPNPLLRSSKHRERHAAQDRLEELNTQLTNMVQALDGWRYIHYMMTVKDTHIQPRRDDLEAPEIERGDDQLDKAREKYQEAEKEYQKVLDQYQKGNAQPDEWKSFKAILDWFNDHVA